MLRLGCCLPPLSKFLATCLVGTPSPHVPIPFPPWLQPLYSLVNSTTKNISEDLDAETTTLKSIVSPKLPVVFLNESTRMNLDQFLKRFWKYMKQHLPPYTGCFTIVETKRLGTNPGF